MTIRLAGGNENKANPISKRLSKSRKENFETQVGVEMEENTNVVTYDDLIAYTYGFGPAEFQTKREFL